MDSDLTRAEPGGGPPGTVATGCHLRIANS